LSYIGNTPADKYQTLEKQSFTTSATTGYTLSYSVSSPQDIALFINNVRQNPNSSYTVSGTTLTLTSATTGTDVMYAVFLGKSVGTIAPAVGSVTNDMLSGSIATSKLADGSTFGQTNTPSFCARESGQQTLSHNTYTNLTFGTEEIDSDGAFASNVFTVPSGQDGKYFLQCQINVYDAEGNLSSGMLAIWKGTNGTKLSNLYSTHTNTNNTQNHLSISVSVIADLAVGDVIGAAATMTTDDSGTATSYGGDQGTRILGFKLI